MNNVILQGRLVAEPELKTTNSGVEVCSFRIAVNQDYVKQGEERKADFINIVAWRQTAAFVCKYYHKGDGILIKGRLQSRQYEKDGENRTAVEVVADNVEFPLSKSSNNNSLPNGTPAPASVPRASVLDADSIDIIAEDDDDLPFN